MRQVGLSDLDMTARVLLAHPRGGWSPIVTKLVEDAHRADLWRKRTGLPHPDGGTGSLFAQASLMPRATTHRSDPRYLSALSVALAGVEAWRGRLQ